MWLVSGGSRQPVGASRRGARAMCRRLRLVTRIGTKRIVPVEPSVGPSRTRLGTLRLGDYCGTMMLRQSTGFVGTAPSSGHDLAMRR